MDVSKHERLSNVTIRHKIKGTEPLLLFCIPQCDLQQCIHAWFKTQTLKFRDITNTVLKCYLVQLQRVIIHCMY